MQMQHRLAPSIWYPSGAEDAVARDLNVFGADQGRVTHMQRWGENAPRAAGTVMPFNVDLPGLQMTPA